MMTVVYRLSSRRELGMEDGDNTIAMETSIIMQYMRMASW